MPNKVQARSLLKLIEFLELIVDSGMGLSDVTVTFSTPAFFFFFLDVLS